MWKSRPSAHGAAREVRAVAQRQYITTQYSVRDQTYEGYSLRMLNYIMAVYLGCAAPA